MTFRIAVVSDIHDSADRSHPRRRRELGRFFLERTIRLLNRSVRPDAVLLLGDLIDRPDASDAVERLQGLKRLVDLLEAPTIVIPGNHDPEPEVFYTVFSKPDHVVDIRGVRFLPFIDPEEPRWNARRRHEDLDRMRYARVGHSGPVIAVQHVPVLPSGTADCPYGYTNADDIVSLMEEHAIALAVAGHYHAGTPLIHHGKCAYLVVKALCESPFTFTVITIDDHEVTAVDEHTLDREIPSRSPGAYGTVDQDGEVSTSDAEASDP